MFPPSSAIAARRVRARAFGYGLVCACLATIDPCRADDRDFDVFIAQFRAAVVKPDAAAVADLARLPFQFENEPRERAAFEAIVPVLFDASVRSCLAQEKAIVEDDARVIFCGAYAFYFRRQPQGNWKLEEFGVDGEALP